MKIKYKYLAFSFLTILIWILFFDKNSNFVKNKSKAISKTETNLSKSQNKKLDIKSIAKPFKKSKLIIDESKNNSQKQLSKNCVQTFEVLNSRDFFALKLDEHFWEKSLACLKDDFKDNIENHMLFFNSCKDLESTNTSNTSCLDFLLGFKGSLFLLKNAELLNSDLKKLEDHELFGLYLGQRFHKKSFIVDDFKKSEPLLKEMYLRFSENKSINLYVLMEFGIFSPQDSILTDVKSYFERNYPKEESYLSLKHRETEDYQLQKEIFSEISKSNHPNNGHIEQHAFAIWKNEGKSNTLVFLQEQLNFVQENYNPTSPEYKTYVINRLKKLALEIKNDQVSIKHKPATFQIPQLIPLLIGQER